MIYMDNAATSFPKAPGVAEAMGNAVRMLGGNPGRGGHSAAGSAAEEVYLCRENLARLFGIVNPERIAFTLNCTDSLNVGLKGILRRGDRVITTDMEHNAVVRPLRRLEEAGIMVDVAHADPEGRVALSSIAPLRTPNTRLIVMTHASNVCGTKNPIREIGAWARREGILFMVDAAQTAGIVPIHAEHDCIDILCFPGHKGLLGPQGTGGIYVREGISIRPLREGGTGADSESPYMPNFFPDRLEGGTVNLPGIIGLKKSTEYLLIEGESVQKKESESIRQMTNGLHEIPHIRVVGKRSEAERVGVFSIVVPGMDSVECAECLERLFDIAVRSGLHCAPWAHRALGTLSTGTVRFSLSPFTERDEIDAALSALRFLAECGKTGKYR